MRGEQEPRMSDSAVRRGFVETDRKKPAGSADLVTL
jgi:hypothetical protein